MNDDWFSQVDSEANKYFAKLGSADVCFVRISGPAFIGSHPNPDEPRVYRVTRDLTGIGKHKIELW